jgi:carboxylesterase
VKSEFYEPIFLSGSNKVGVLLIHGFTGTPKSVEPWAYGLNSAGFTVHVPRLAGHGSDWREMRKSSWVDWLESVDDALKELASKVDEIFIAGFSMGGALALRLAEIYPELISGLLLLNPTIYDNHIRMTLAKVLAPFIPSIKSEGTDVAKPNALITSQQRLSLHAANSLHKFRHIVRKDLSIINMPIKLFLSRQDHVVPPSNGLLVANSVNSEHIEITYFELSYHVVALDYEADQLVQESIEFLSKQSKLITQSSLNVQSTVSMA